MFDLCLVKHTMEFKNNFENSLIYNIEDVQLGDTVLIRFHDAGHILGSSIIEVCLREQQIHSIQQVSASG